MYYFYLGVFIDAKLHFHNHINQIFSHCIKLLGLVRSITFTFSSLGYVLRLYIILVHLSLNMRPLSGIQLRQLMTTSWNASSRGLRASVLIVSFLKSITVILLLWWS
jgi:hypothetical protein